jgi:uncharacterized protein
VPFGLFWLKVLWNLGVGGTELAILIEHVALMVGTMLSRNEILQLLQREQKYLSTEFGVSRIGLFGSYAAGRVDETSDIDLVMEFERPIGFRFLELVDYLEAVLGRKVDVLTPAGLKSIRINQVVKSISESVVYV